MRRTSENQIKLISKKLIRSFFGDRKPDYLFSLLAADVYYLGAGENMRAEGKKKVEFFISQYCGDMLPTVVTQDKYITKRIGWDHWLCEVSCNLHLTEEGKEAVQECLHETLIFRRCKDGKQEHSGWELIYIHNSLTTKRFSSEEMRAIQQANKTRRNTRLYDGLTEREKKLVRMIRNGIQIRDIAAEFGLAEITIKKALAKLYHKYNVKNRARLCAYFDAQENDY